MPPHRRFYYQPRVTLQLWLAYDLHRFEALADSIKSIDAARPWTRCYKPDGDPAPGFVLSPLGYSSANGSHNDLPIFVEFGPGAPIKSERIDEYRSYAILLVERLISELPGVSHYRFEQRFDPPVFDSRTRELTVSVAS